MVESKKNKKNNKKNNNNKKSSDDGTTNCNYYIVIGNYNLDSKKMRSRKILYHPAKQKELPAGKTKKITEILNNKIKKK